MVFGSMLTHYPTFNYLPILHYGLHFMLLAQSGHTLSFSSADTRRLSSSSEITDIDEYLLWWEQL